MSEIKDHVHIDGQKDGDMWIELSGDTCDIIFKYEEGDTDRKTVISLDASAAIAICIELIKGHKVLEQASIARFLLADIVKNPEGTVKEMNQEKWDYIVRTSSPTRGLFHYLHGAYEHWKEQVNGEEE